MGHTLSRNRDEAGSSKLRRIYVGKVPELSDEDEGAPVGKKGRLQRTSQQSFTDKEYVISPLERRPSTPVTPIRRHSVVSTPKKPKKKKAVIFPNNEVTSSRYTLLNFFPRNLFEQFRRIVNFYFLVVAVIQTATDSPVSPVTAIAPLAFVVVVTMIKQGYEDWLRHKADNLFNTRPIKYVSREGVLENKKSKDVRVGDIIKLDVEEQVPADVILLGSSDEFQRCLLNTANLDGETNLKMRYVPAGLPYLRREEDFRGLNLIVECEEPCEDLYRFNGNILIPPEFAKSPLGTIYEDSHIPNGSSNDISSIPEIKVTSPNQEEQYVGISDFNMIFLGMENMLLRGTKVKNTEFVYGVVIYTGPDTRLARNSKPPKPKFSTIERTVNKYLFVFIAILVILVISATLVSILVDWFAGGSSPWYVDDTKNEKTAKFYWETFSSFLILFNYIIPISLYVTMEMQKFIGSKFFVWDLEMTGPGEPALCNTSDLNEELGQIDYLFSDKTGTLTENVMKTRMLSVASGVYEVADSQLFLRDPEDNTRRNERAIQDDPNLIDFCRVLSLCHSIQIMPKKKMSIAVSGGRSTPLKIFLKKKKQDKDKGFANLSSSDESAMEDSEFQGSSPDEKALVESCVQLGITYQGENEEVLTLNVFGRGEKYKRHMMLEFDADRKCMSVIVENEAGEIYLMTKGAETAVLPRCDTGPIEDVNKHVLSFAMMGYRTLVIARRKLAKEELDDYLSQLKAARRLVENRDEVMRQIYRDIESHLEVIGSTGVEDQLQEGVVETLHALGAAGVRVWVLTGDKVETAVAVAYACGLLTSLSKQLMLCKFSEETKHQLHNRLKEMNNEIDSRDNNVLVIDGETLEIAFKHCQEIFSTVAMKAFRVVCCRMTPLQKSQVVKMVKDSPAKPVTAAVGDGANDVAMIQEAHIGLGIFGKEGRQAARSADFAVAKFGFIRKAILVHGHWYYVRLANLANYFFYKNIIFVIPQVLFCFSTTFSTQPLFDGIFLMMYNIFFTACPVLIYGLMEQPHSRDELLDNAYLYKEIHRNSLMTAGVFLKWLLSALWHALVCYFVVFFSWPSFNPLHDLSSFGTTVFSGIVAVANMKLLLETRYISWWVFGSHCISYLAYFTFTALYSQVDLTGVWVDPQSFRNVFFSIMSPPIFWALMLFITCTALMPDTIWKVLENSGHTVINFFKSLPKKLRLSGIKNGKQGFPSLLFSKSKETVTVSSATLHSYLSKTEL